MRQKIENRVLVRVDDFDLTQAVDLVVYIRQNDVFLEYIPDVANAHEMIVYIPLADAMRLQCAACKMQIAGRDAQGMPFATDVQRVPVHELLKEEGYSGG